jgi:hypothetical protein
MWCKYLGVHKCKVLQIENKLTYNYVAVWINNDPIINKHMVYTWLYNTWYKEPDRDMCFLHTDVLNHMIILQITWEQLR